MQLRKARARARATCPTRTGLRRRRRPRPRRCRGGLAEGTSSRRTACRWARRRAPGRGRWPCVASRGPLFARARRRTRCPHPGPNPNPNPNPIPNPDPHPEQVLDDLQEFLAPYRTTLDALFRHCCRTGRGGRYERRRSPRWGPRSFVTRSARAACTRTRWAVFGPANSLTLTSLPHPNPHPNPNPNPDPDPNPIEVGNMLGPSAGERDKKVDLIFARANIDERRARQRRPQTPAAAAVAAALAAVKAAAAEVGVPAEALETPSPSPAASPSPGASPAMRRARAAPDQVRVRDGVRVRVGVGVRGSTILTPAPTGQGARARWSCASSSTRCSAWRTRPSARAAHYSLAHYSLLTTHPPHPHPPHLPAHHHPTPTPTRQASSFTLAQRAEELLERIVPHAQAGPSRANPHRPHPNAHPNRNPNPNRKS